MGVMAAVAVPLLMLAEKEENKEKREFWDLSKGVTYTMSLPELAGKCCYGVGFPGWLFTADQHGHANLFHLFTRTVINLPDMDTLEGFVLEEELGCDFTFVDKALLSSDPLSSTDDDYVLALIQGYPRTLAFWRPGSKSFSSVDSHGAFSDVTWHDGHFYGVGFMGHIFIFDFTSSQKDYYPTTAARVIISQIPPEVACSNTVYTVYSMGELLVINRDGAYDEEGDDSYGAKQFHVYKINFDDDSYEEVKDLGNRALFLGFGATLAVERPHEIPGCHANRIYFTDDCKEAYFSIERGGGKDMGVYNLLDGTIVPHYTGQSYHRVTPPLWVFSNITHS